MELNNSLFADDHQWYLHDEMKLVIIFVILTSFSKAIIAHAFNTNLRFAAQ